MNPPDRKAPPPRPGSVRLPSVREERAPDAVVRDPSLGGPPPAPRREQRKPTVPGGFVAVHAPPTIPPAQAPASEAFGEDEADTSPASPHALSEPPVGSARPIQTNPPPEELAERQSYADLEAENAKLKVKVQDLSPAVRVEVEPPARRRRDWYPAIVKLALGLGALAAAVTAYLTARTEHLESKTDTVKAVQVVTVEQYTALASRVSELEQRDRQRGAHEACIERQDRDAHLRGSGHDLTSEPRGGTDWAEQRRPSAKPHQPGEPAVYFTTESCPAAPP